IFPRRFRARVTDRALLSHRECHSALPISAFRSDGLALQQSSSPTGISRILSPSSSFTLKDRRASRPRVPHPHRWLRGSSLLVTSRVTLPGFHSKIGRGSCRERV